MAWYCSAPWPGFALAFTQCDVRLTLKTQDQTLMRQAMDGAGLTRWEAAILPRVVEDIYFQGGLNPMPLTLRGVTQP